MDGPDFSPNLLVPASIVGAIIVALVGWIGWRFFKRDRSASSVRRDRNSDYQRHSRVQTSVPAAETIWQINNILGSIETRFGITPAIMQDPSRLEEKLERIRSRLNAINSGTFHAANLGFEKAASWVQR